MPKKIVNAKIALLDMNLQKGRMGLGVHVVINDPTKLEEIKNKSVFPTKSLLCPDLSFILSLLCRVFIGRLRWPRTPS